MPLNVPQIGGAGGEGLGQAPAMPHFGNIDLGALVNAAVLPPGIQMLQGLADLPGYFQQAQSDAAKAQVDRLQAQDYRMKIADNQWDQAIALIQKNPQLAQNPAMIRHLTQLSSITGYSLPKDSRGNIDDSVWGTSLTDFLKTKDLADRWFSADSAGKHTIARMYHLTGITPEDYAAAPVRTGSEEVAFEKVGLDKEKTDAYVKNQAGYYAAKDHQLYALSASEQADARYHYAMGQAAITRANGYLQQIHNQLTIANDKNATAIQVAQIHSSGSQIQYRSAIHASEEAVRQATELYNKTKEQLTAMYAAGASPDDDEVKPVRDAVDAAQKAIDKANIQLQDVQRMGPGMQQDAQSRDLSRTANKKATVQGHFIVGRVYPDANGNRAKYLGGDPSSMSSWGPP